MADKLAEGGEESRAGQPAHWEFPRTVEFLRDVRTEMRKVITPTREEVQTTTTVVIVTVFIFAAYFYVVDAGLSRVIQSMLRQAGRGTVRAEREKRESR